MSDRPATRVIQALTSAPWLITEDGFELLMEIASRDNVITADVAAAIAARQELVAAREASRPDGKLFDQRGTVGIIDVSGPITRYSDMFSQISGGTSTSAIAKAFGSAMDDPNVKSILFHFDSPGGEAKGINELASMIADARGKKPIAGYIESAGSAAYWLASAVDPGSLVIDATGFAGSIGARLSMPTARSSNSVEFVSEQSPKKVLDPNSGAGRAELQQRANALAQIFVEGVAKNRGMAPEAVTSTEGRMLMGQKAIDAGLADRIGSFEGLLGQLQSRKPLPAAARMADANEEEIDMDSKEKRSLLSRFAVALGLSAEDASTEAAEPVAEPVAVADAAVAAVAAENQQLRDQLKLQEEALARIAAQEQEQRKAAVDAKVTAFVSEHSPKLGKESTVAMTELYTSAIASDNSTLAAQIENLAKSLPVVGTTRVPTADGPTPESLAAKVVPMRSADVGRVAAERVRARGIEPKTAEWQPAYLKEVAKVRAEVGNA